MCFFIEEMLFFTCGLPSHGMGSVESTENIYLTHL